ncbi:hypothetical protein GCM10011506_24320 [Marivirga lumbricoides]|uniref:histidine kinase n=1 Tax=Marivirga lumbricoides TaxID=1046115 RepID=A0ABQ1MC68_9BACT|nr:hypothetical protein GCM10011506_24320 [Marivirga lumbricoides]
MTAKEISKLIEESNDLTCSINIKGQFTWLRNAAHVFLGYTKGELMNKSIVDFVPEEDAGANQAFFQTLNATTKSQRLINRMIAKDGSIVQVEWVARWNASSEEAFCYVNVLDSDKEVIIGRMKENESYRNLFHHSPLPNIICSLSTFSILEVNQATLSKLGFNRQELSGWVLTDLFTSIDKQRFDEIKQQFKDNDNIVELGVWNLKNSKGATVKMHLSGYRFSYNQEDCIMLIFNDVTEDQLLKELDVLERKTMEASIQMVFNLKGLLYKYVRGLEAIFEGLKVSILMVHDGKLYNLVSPSLPKPYIEAIEGEKIGEAAGSCGTAAFRKERVIVSDINADPLWRDYRSLALENGVMSCWSEPIFNYKKEVVATFANYYPSIKEPSQQELNFFKRSATLLSLILENHQKGEALFSSNERYNYVNRATEDAIYDWDVENDIFEWGGGFQRIFLHNYKNKTFRLQDWANLMHPKDHEHTDKSWEAFLANKRQSRWNREFRFKRGNGTYAHVEEIGHLIRDSEGKPKRMIGVLRDRTEQKKEEHRLKLMERVVTNANDSIVITEAQPVDEPGPRIIYVNEAFTKMTGYLPAEVIGKTPRILQGPESDKVAIKELSSAIRKMHSHEITTVNYKKNGEKYWVHFSVVPVANEEGVFTHWIAVQRDVTVQIRKELQKNLLNEISQLFNQQINLKLTLEKVLKRLVQFGEIFLAEAWLLDEDKKKVNLLAKYANDRDGQIFYEESLDIINFEYGIGLPGKVWELKKAVLWNDLDNKDLFLRNKAAKKIGLKSGLGIPLFHNNSIVGVMVFLSRLPEQALSSYEFLFKELETQLGIEIKRKMLEDEFFQFFNNAPDILSVAGADGKFKRVNPAFCKLMGYSEEELTKRKFTDFILPEDRAQTQQEYAETIVGLREADSFINRYVTRNGEQRWISWNSSKIYNNEGLAFAYGRDITEKRKLENLLQSANSLARIGGWELDFENETLYFSKITREIHEVDENYIPNLEEGINFYREDVRQFVRETVNAAIEQNKEWDFEQPIITAKGNECWVRSMGKPEFRDGKCVKIIGSFQDIHERKVAELRLQNIADNVPGAIFQYILLPDKSEKILFLSKGAKELWGHSADTCMNDISIIWKQAESAGDLVKVKESLKVSAETMDRWHCQYKSRLPNGAVVWHEAYGTPQKLQNGAILWDSFIIDITEKKELEYLVERSSQIALIGNWELDLKEPDNEVMYWSDMTREILEVDENYIPTFSKGFDFYTPDSRSNIEVAFDKLINNGEDFDLELLLETAKGNEKWIRLIGRADLLEGECVRVYGSLQDIHQRKMAELDLYTAFQEKNMILESISDGFFALDKNWIVTYWNEKAEVLLDTPKEVVLNKNIWKVFGDATDSLSYKMYQKCLKEQVTVHFEEYITSNNKWFEVSAYPSAKGLSAFFKDVTERKRAEELIRQSNERFEIVTQATNDAIWDYNVVDNELFWGKGFQTLFKHDLTVIKPSFELLTSFIHPEDRDRVSVKVQQFMNEKSSVNWYEEFRFKKADGTYAYVIDRAIFLRNKRGKVTRVLGAMTDISHRKEFEQSLQSLNETLDKRAKELAVSNAELEQFAFVASHDLQEPLRMITSFLAQLENKYSDKLDEKAQKYIYFAVDGAKRMRQIILDLLEFSRAGRNVDESGKLPVKELVSEAQLLQRRTIAQTSAKIVVESLPDIQLQKAPFLQVFQNLIGNALKYSKDDVSPEITISAKSTKDSYVFSVADNGIGIEEKYFEKIFIIFQRLHTKDKYKGSGMGLSIVKKIIENNGGRIWLKSKVGKGTTFYFTVPKG